MTHPVLLVGAGPGDPELLTLKAVRAIAQADVILIDDLVNPEVLQHAQATARVQWVGKRGGCASTPQAFIQKLMVREALAGQRVVRLKGGDPLVFGRAGEEIEALREAGLAFDIVSGITSAVAAAAGLQVSLTNRLHSPGVVLVTGHPHRDDAASAAAPGWVALAQAGYTLCIYMGVARASQIQQQLLDAGLDPATPAAVVAHASLPSEQRIVTRLDQLVSTVQASGVGSPAVLLVGKAVDAASPACEVPVEFTSAIANR